MPTGGVYNKIAEMISTLSRRYESPDFPPHVTLLGGLLGSEEEIVRKTEQLAGQIRPLTIMLTHVDSLKEYFRCLYLRADESADLEDMNRIARGIFDRHQDPKFTPHLSLMYGTFPPQVKEKIIQELRNVFSMRFEARSIHLYSTNGEPKDWYRVKQLDL